MALTLVNVGPFEIYQNQNRDIVSVIIHRTREKLQIKVYLMLLSAGPQCKYPDFPALKKLAYQVFDEVATLYQQGNFRLGSYFVDHFFNSFSIMWNHLRSLNFHRYAAETWNLACRLVNDWENRNSPIKIHKGTPFYFLGRTYIENGELDLGFNLIYKAIDEDRLNSQNIWGNQVRFMGAPAYMYATLDNNPNNNMIDYVRRLRTIIEKYLKKYRDKNGPFGQTSNLTMKRLDRKFLRAGIRNPALRDPIFWFVYLIQYLDQRNSSKSSLSSLDVYKNDFAKISNLNILFNLCLVIDEVFRIRFQRAHFGGNIADFTTFKLCWPINNHNLQLLENNLRITQNNQVLDPNTWLTNGLNLTWTTGVVPIDPRLQVLFLCLGLRNYGGHNLRGQIILTDKFEEIIEKLMFALFIGIELLT